MGEECQLPHHEHGIDDGKLSAFGNYLAGCFWRLTFAPCSWFIFCYFTRLAGSPFFAVVVSLYPDGYNLGVKIFHRTEKFSKWLKGLKDPLGKASVLRRIERAESQGNFGDHQSVGDSVCEMRIFVGPGYRLYYTHVGDEIVWLLMGGDKSSQTKDIELAKEMAADIHGQP